MSMTNGDRKKFYSDVASSAVTIGGVALAATGAVIASPYIMGAAALVTATGAVIKKFADQPERNKHLQQPRSSAAI